MTLEVLMGAISEWLNGLRANPLGPKEAKQTMTLPPTQYMSSQN